MLAFGKYQNTLSFSPKQNEVNKELALQPKSMSLQEKQHIFRRQLAEEFIREFNFIADVVAGRAQAKGDFTDKVLGIVKAVTGEILNDIGVPGMSLLNSIAEIGFEWISDKQKEGKHEHVSLQQTQIDQEQLRILLELVAYEASRRYEFILATKLPDTDVSTIVSFAKVGVARMLEYAARNRLPLNYNNLLMGLIAGRSGGLVEGIFNNTFTSKQDADEKLSFEGAYSRTGLTTADDKFWLLPDKSKARHKQIESPDPKPFFDKLKQKFKNRYNYGYTKLNKTNDPKYGFIMVPQHVVDYLYPAQSRQMKTLEILSDKLRDEVVQNPPTIQVVTRADIKAYLEYIKEKNISVSFNEYMRAKRPTLITTIYLPETEDEFDLTDFDFSHSDFSGCILNGCILAGSLANANFNNASLIGANFTGVTQANQANFSEAHLEYLNAQSANLSGAIFTQAHLHYANLAQAQLHGIKAKGAFWIKANLAKADIKSTHSQSDLESIVQEQIRQQEAIEKYYKEIKDIKAAIQSQDHALQKMSVLISQFDNIKTGMSMADDFKDEVQQLQNMLIQLLSDKAAYEANSRFYETELKELNYKLQDHSIRMNNQGFHYIQALETQQTQLCAIARKFEQLSLQIEKSEVSFEDFRTQKSQLQANIKQYQQTQQEQLTIVRSGLTNLQTELTEYKQEIKDEHAFLLQQINALHKQVLALQLNSAVPKLPIIDTRHAISYFQLTFGRHLVRGTIADIYLGYWSGKQVIIKMITDKLSPDLQEAFLREISIIAKLHHPQVIKFHGTCLENGIGCIVMEYMDNGNLYDYLAQSKGLSEQQQINVALAVANGLSYLHTNAILHRDFRSGNVLINSKGKAKLTGFGFAKIEAANIQTAKKKFDVNQAWLAPECLKDNVYTAASDVYSYGIVLWEIVTGCQPNPGKKIDISIVPNEYKDIIVNCLNELPEQRPCVQSIIERLKAIEVKLDSQSMIQNTAIQSALVNSTIPYSNNNLSASNTTFDNGKQTEHEDQTYSTLSRIFKSSLPNESLLLEKQCNPASANINSNENNALSTSASNTIETAEQYFERGKTFDKAGQFSEARYYYQQAVDKGCFTALTNLAHLSFLEKKYEYAYTLYLEAANGGSLRAMQNIALMLEQGKGINKNISHALFWYKKLLQTKPFDELVQKKIVELETELSLQQKHNLTKSPSIRLKN